MKKLLYSIFAIGTMFYTTSCDNENRGTTTEVVDANDDASVDPEHIRGYGENPSNTNVGTEGSANELYRQRAENIAAKMASDLNLDKETQSRVTEIYLNSAQQLGQLSNTEQYNATSRMGGEPDNDTEADMAKGTESGVAEQNNDNASDNASGAAQIVGAEDQNKIMQEMETKLKAALTAEQWQAYEQNREKYSLK